MVSLNDFIRLQGKIVLDSVLESPTMAKGSCICGRITYEFDVEPVRTVSRRTKPFDSCTNRKQVLCHCLNCRRITGTAYSSNLTVPSSAMTTKGEPKQFEFDSGQGPIFNISFCGDCGSTMWKESDTTGFKGYHYVQSGTLGREFERFKPEAEIFVAERAHWLEPLEGARQFDGTDAHSYTE